MWYRFLPVLCSFLFSVAFIVPSFTALRKHGLVVYVLEVEQLEAFRKMKQDKSPNKPPGGGDQKALVNVKDASCSLVMGYPTD